MLSAPSQLLEKHSELFETGNTLIVDPLISEGYSSTWTNTDIWSFRALNFSSRFKQVTYPEKPPARYDNIIIYYPKSKDKLPLLINELIPYTHNDSVLFIVGENKGGIKTLKKNTHSLLTYANKVAAGKHSVLYQAQISPELTYQADLFNYFSVNINNAPHTVASLPGVFCHGKLDGGTQFLLENLPDNIKGRVYDFACGYGVIGSYLNTHFDVSDLYMSDIDALAVKSTEKTLELNNISAKVAISDGLIKNSSKFDWIFTNPPFHTGVKIDYDISVEFFKSCKRNLQQNGQLIVVANSFLKYPQILQTQFQRVNVIAENTKFKVYMCS